MLCMVEDFYKKITDHDLFIYLDKSDIINPHQQHTEDIYYITDESDHLKIHKFYSFCVICTIYFFIKFLKISKPQIYKQKQKHQASFMNNYNSVV